MFTKILTSSLLFLVAIGGFFVSVENNGVIYIEHASAGNVGTGFGGVGTDASVGTPSNPSPGGGTTTRTVGPSTAEMEKMYNNFVAILNIILGALSFIVMPAIILASWLTSPDWTSGDAFGLRDIMHDIWIIISNIVYFIYAILLIIIALATILGKDNFSYKAMLPKLALGILMVPFTWWFVQWTVSLATVVTASVLTIPQEVMNNFPSQPGSFWTTPVIPREITIDANANASTTYTNCELYPQNCLSPEAFYQAGGGIWSPLVIYGYGIFKFQEFKSLEKWTGLSNIVNLVHQGLLGAIMFIVFGILVIALIFILMTRAIKLWVYAMFSPLFTLHFVAGKEIMGKMGDDKDTFSIQEFIGLCFVPAIIGITLSFGLIVLSVMVSPTTVTNPTNNGITLFGNPENRIISTPTPEGYTRVEIAGTTTTFRGNFGGTGGPTVGSGLNSIFGGLGSFFGTIIVDIIALVFIWSAFMAAKGVNKAVGIAMEPFDKLGKDVGNMAKSLPKYTPLPIPGGSISGLNRTIDLGKSAIDTRQRQKEETAIGKFMPGLLQGTIKAETNARYQSAMGTDRDNFTKTREHVASVTSGASSEREKNWDDIAKGFAQITSESIRKDWQYLGKNLTEKQKDAYNELITGKTDKVNALSITDKAEVWKIFGSSGGTTGSTSSSGTSGAEFTGSNATIKIQGVNVTMTDVSRTSTASEIADALKKDPNTMRNLKERLSEGELISAFKSINDTLTDDKIKEVVTRDLKDLLKKSGGGGGPATS